MFAVPAVATAATAWMLRSYGVAALFAACAAFLATQLIIIAYWDWRVARAKRRLMVLRARRGLRPRG